MGVLYLTVLCLSVVVISAQKCIWPKFFDVSQRGFPVEDDEISWETEGKIDTKDNLQRVNWFLKTKKLILVKSNHTLKITEGEVKGNELKIATYECENVLEDNKIVLKKITEGSLYMAKNVDPPMYSCIQLIKVSKYVLRWRMGGESQTVPNCAGEFAPISPSPLVYYPLRNVAGHSKIFRHHDFLQDYPECPPMGAYHLRVFDERGQDICKNDDPSPVLEMECARGEGLRLMPSSKDCSQYTFTNREAGSKLNCLGHWEEDNYQFIVLAPNGELRVNSFHCLRINKNRPTDENAVLFLDQTCKTGPPEPSQDTYFIFSLSPKTINNFCDDWSDQCETRKCGDSSGMKYSCMTTCDSCPINNGAVSPDKSIQDSWIFQKRNNRKDIVITETEFTIMDMGTFKAYGSELAGDSCVHAPPLLKVDTYSYVLARIGDHKGCGPRVTQFRARLIGSSVLLMQAMGSSPLRPNEYAANPKTWCKNNYWDVDAFSPLFTPNAPYATFQGLFQLPTAYFTLVKKGARKGECNLEEYDVLHGAHMKVKVQFKHKNKDYNCDGETHVNSPNKWRLTYDCGEEGSGDILFDCLETYSPTNHHQALILYASPTASDNAILPLTDEYYCLILPSGKVGDPQHALLNTAGECDNFFENLVNSGIRDVLVKMSVTEMLNHSNVPSISGITLLITVILSIYY